jgi:hypothetical protein
MKALYIFLQTGYIGGRGTAGVLARISILGSDIRHTVSSTDAPFFKILRTPFLVLLFRTHSIDPYIQFVHKLGVAREIPPFFV